MQTQLGRWKSGGCATTGVGVDRRTPKGSGGSAFPPEEIGGEANEKQNDGGGEIHEVRRVEEGKINLGRLHRLVAQDLLQVVDAAAFFEIPDSKAMTEVVK